MSDVHGKCGVGNCQYTYGQDGALPEKCPVASCSYNYGHDLNASHAHDDDHDYNNKGNPVFSCPTVVPSTTRQMETESEGQHQHKLIHPMYRTTSADYGANPATVHTVPITYHAKSQQFSNQLGKCGMFRNRSLNTAMDTSNVPEH